MMEEDVSPLAFLAGKSFNVGRPLQDNQASALYSHPDAAHEVHVSHEHKRAPRLRRVRILRESAEFEWNQDL